MKLLREHWNSMQININKKQEQKKRQIYLFSGQKIFIYSPCTFRRILIYLVTRVPMWAVKIGKESWQNWVSGLCVTKPLHLLLYYFPSCRGSKKSGKLFFPIGCQQSFSFINISANALLVNYSLIAWTIRGSMCLSGAFYIIGR